MKKKLNKDLIQRFANTYEFGNGDINKFILSLRKGVYPYEYIDSWQRFDETSLPDKEAFYNNLNMEDITDVDYRHGKTAFEYLINKYLGDYHDLYVQSDTLLLPDVLESFRNMCIKVYELDPAHFFICTWISMVKLELLTDVDMLLMVEKGMRGGIYHAIYRYGKANNKYMKNYNKDKEESFLQYLDDNSLYGWAMSEKFPVSGFKWKKNTSKFTKEFTKNYDECSNKGYILEIDAIYSKNLHGLHENLPF